MTIIKTFLIDLRHDNGSIDNLMPFKATTIDLAKEMAANASPEAYIGTIIRMNESRKYWRQFRINRVLRQRVSNTGQFRFQHKGKKRRGMKNYPSPKYGWRKLYPPLIITWTEKYNPVFSNFIKQWADELLKPDRPEPAPVAELTGMSPAQETLWNEWVEGRPDVIRKMIADYKFRPDVLYKLKTTGQRVTLYSFEENGTLTINVLAQFNPERMLTDLQNRSVFGINPADLEVCKDWPLTDEEYFRRKEQLQESKLE